MHSVLATKARSRISQKVCSKLSLICPISAANANLLSADIISTVEFDSTGNYLATGDKGGRVVLFERNEMVRASTYFLRSHVAEIHQDPHSYRKKAVNTNSTQSSNHMSPNSTTSKVWKSRRRSIRSNGAGDKMLRIFCYRPTVCPYLIDWHESTILTLRDPLSIYVML